MSRFEELLQALLTGESIDIEPESRVEAILKNIIEGKGVEGLPEPQSRTESYLMAIAEKGVGGGDIPAVIQALTVTENGTYEAPEGVDGYGPVVVNVSATGDGYEVLNAVIDKSIVEISTNATSISSSVFQSCSQLTMANFPVATSINTNAFRDCSSLKTADFPAVTSIGEYAFYGCSSLTTADFPTVTSLSGYTFRNCYKLTTVNFPVATSIGAYAFGSCEDLTTVNFPVATSIGSNAFEYCYALRTVDFPEVTSIVGSAFRDCSNLRAFILRSSALVTIGTNGFKSTPIASGTGYIYVPSALIEQYKTASNWSTYAAQFRALEDYTVDGTTTGALDETKI